MNLRDARRILVVTKFRYLGDTIVATPFLKRLKESAPAAEVTLLSGAAMLALLRGCPYLSDIVPYESRGPGKFSRSLALARDLRARNFGAVFLLNRSLHSALVARLARIPVRIGFDTEHRGPLLTTRVPYDWAKPDRDCALDLLRAARLPAEPALPELWVSEEEQAAARILLADRGIEPARLLVGMQPGAHDPEVREWGAARFAAVANRLAAERGAQMVLLGSKEERPVSDEVAGQMQEPPAVLTGETDLRQALSVISLCNLWVGNDGGLLHAAVALGPATVGIFGPTKAKRWGYSEPRHRTVAHYTADGAVTPAAIRASLDAIEPDEVYAAAKAGLAASSLNHPD